jgi:Flp pilus assembly protein TadG
MTVLETFTRLREDRNGNTAAEFALVLPILLFFLFCIIDIGRLYFNVNEAEKATQMGARFAVVTDTIPTQISGADYVGVVACDANNDGVLDACTKGGQIKDQGALATVTCTSGGCTPSSSGVTMNAGAFDRLVSRMQAFDPAITASNVKISFRGSGLGFAGDPTGMDVVPLVTVELYGLSFSPIAFLSLVPFNLPSARTTLSAESSSGVESN